MKGSIFSIRRIAASTSSPALTSPLCTRAPCPIPSRSEKSSFIFFSPSFNVCETIMQMSHNSQAGSNFIQFQISADFDKIDLLSFSDCINFTCADSSNSNQPGTPVGGIFNTFHKLFVKEIVYNILDVLLFQHE